jgi:hypothetical protein
MKAEKMCTKYLIAPIREMATRESQWTAISDRGFKKMGCCTVAWLAANH